MDMSYFNILPWLPALVIATYLFVKKKKRDEILETSVKAMLGYYLILAGAALAAEALMPLSILFQKSFGIRVGILNSEIFGAALLQTCGNAGFFAFLVAFAVNLGLAKFTAKGWLFLTGHHLLFLSLLSVCLFRDIGNLPVAVAALLGGAAVGLYAYVSVGIGVVCMERLKLCGKAGLANSAVGAAVIGTVAGKLLSRRKRVRFGKEGKCSGYVTSLGVVTVLGLYLLLVKKMECGWSIEGIREACRYALLYGVALVAIVYGIRLLIGPLLPIFWECGKRFLPNLIVGLDSTAVITYAPRAWRRGFLAASVTGTVTCLCLWRIQTPSLALPGYTSLYFAGGVAGVFGNAEGGKCGASVAGAITGVLVILLMSAFMELAGLQTGVGSSFGETEYGLFGCIVSLLVKLITKKLF